MEPEVYIELAYTDVEPNGENWRVGWAGDFGDGEEWFAEKADAAALAREMQHDAGERGYLAQLVVRRRDGSIAEDRMLGPGAEGAYAAAEGGHRRRHSVGLPGFPLGARVTNEPATYFDGEPVAGWPHAQYTGEVVGSRNVRGMNYVRVLWNSGRMEYELPSRLVVI